MITWFLLLSEFWELKEVEPNLTGLNISIAGEKVLVKETHLDSQSNSKNQADADEDG